MQYFRGGAQLTELSQLREPNFNKVGEDISERSSQHCTFISEFGYLAAFSNVYSSKLSDVENDAKFRTFDHLWKLGEGIVGR